MSKRMKNFNQTNTLNSLSINTQIKMRLLATTRTMAKKILWIVILWIKKLPSWLYMITRVKISLASFCHLKCLTILTGIRVSHFKSSKKIQIEIQIIWCTQRRYSRALTCLRETIFQLDLSTKSLPRPSISSPIF